MTSIVALPGTLLDALAALSPRGRHRSLPGAGHLFPMLQPAWVAGELQRFLNEIEETTA